jgi:hypothetical protein
MNILNVIKKAFLWSYPRNTWQWDVLCVLILIFIFLTPKTWFANGERERRWGHQSGVVTTVLVGAEVVDNASDSSELEQRIRTLTGRPEAKILSKRAKQDSAGNTIGYEVDIR